MMKWPLRALLAVLCAALILAMPFVISSPNMLGEVKADLMDEDDGEDEDDEEGEEILFSRLFFSSAAAEDLIIEETEGDLLIDSSWALPLDFTVPPAPNPEAYTENGYEDASIRVSVETTEEDGVIWHIGRIQIASATQLRTATAGKLTSTKTALVRKLAEKNNAIIALNGDNFVDAPKKTTFEYRMTQKIRSKANKKKDILIIDEKGDFNLFIKSEGIGDFSGTVVNAFTFGPALVKDGVLLTMDTEYGYNPNGKEPRSALGQTGELSYVFVIAEGRGESSGVNHQQLAQKMFDLGCVQAFNLDGGNSAEMVFHEKIYKGMPGGDERTLSDIIYFATAVPEDQR